MSYEGVRKFNFAERFSLLSKDSMFPSVIRVPTSNNFGLIFFASFDLSSMKINNYACSSVKRFVPVTTIIT